MYRQVIAKLHWYLRLSWWSVILYYYSFSIIESITKAHILLSLLYHNSDHNLSYFADRVCMIRMIMHDYV